EQEEQPNMQLKCQDAQDYDYVKDAIFHRYELNVETFRQRFRAYRYSNFDGPREAYQILEMIALEQFIEILPDKVNTKRPVGAVTTRAQAKKADASEGTWGETFSFFFRFV
uniref:SCAN box domain-containing protein n=1 Tax=Xenopus tropicalis TaxID=8364 RepID=A0A803JSV3_XENTR